MLDYVTSIVNKPHVVSQSAPHPYGSKENVPIKCCYKLIAFLLCGFILPFLPRKNTFIVIHISGHMMLYMESLLH